MNRLSVSRLVWVACAIFALVFLERGAAVRAQEQAQALVSAGWIHTCALTAEGGVKCWGDNGFGQLGDGTQYEKRLTPVDVVGLGSGVQAVAAGGYHFTCALTTEGGVKCWGYNGSGELGDGTTEWRRLTPVDVVGLGSGVQAISTGGNHACALTTGGGVKCWGHNGHGQLGDGTGDPDQYSTTPVDVVGLGSGVRDIAAGRWHTCALTRGGGVKCWGSNGNGVLGDGTNIPRPTPVDVVSLDSGVRDIAAGQYHACAVTTHGGVKCWGWDGGNEYGYTPMDVVGLASGVQSIATSHNHTCILTTEGGVKCWGYNAYGQLGDGTGGPNQHTATPADVVGLSSGVQAIAAGWTHTCALTAGGAVKCWGHNVSGQLGDGTTTDRHTPVDVVWESAPSYTLSGRMTLSSGSGLAGATVSAGGRNATTDANGDYQITDLVSGSYTVTPSKPGYTFDPVSRQVSVPPDASGVNFTAQATSARPAVILLPGVMGTELVNTPRCAGRPEGKLWFDLTHVRRLDALYLNDQGTQPRNDCDRITPDGALVWWPLVAPYEEFIAAAERAGYDVLDYPGYDWRLNLDSEADELDTWINLNAQDVSELYLVGHSMGGLLARAYVASATRVAKVEGIVTVGTPYLGAPILVQRLVEGKTGTPADYLLIDSQMKEIARYSPGILQLLPSEASFTGTRLPYYRTLDGGDLSTYEATVEHLIANNHVARQIVDQATVFHRSVDGFDVNFHAQGRYTALYSTDSCTPSIFRERWCLWGPQNLCMRIDNYVMGDATVPGPNADLERLPASARNGVTFCGYEALVLGYAEHGDLLKDNRIIEDVLHILGGEPTEHCDEATAAQAAQAPTGFREITVLGRGRVQVVDGQGVFTGVNDEGIVVNDLPDVTYMLTGSGVILTLPLDAPYQVRIVQGSEQPVQVFGADFGWDDSVEMLGRQAQALFAAVPAPADALVTMANPGAPLAQLRVAVDTNADETPERTYAPDTVIDQAPQLNDSVMPVTAITLQGSKDAQGLFVGSVTITLTATDAGGAGILHTYYSLDAGRTWLVYTGPVQLEASQVGMVLAYSIDKAGNEEVPAKSAVIVSRVYLPSIQR